YALEASTEQVELAVQQSDLGFEAVVFTSEPEASDATIDSPAAGESDRRGSQADDVQDTRADVLGPSARQGYGFRARVSHGLRQPEPRAGDKARSSLRQESSSLTSE